MAIVTKVEALGIDAVQHVHARRQVRPGRLDHEVVVRSHEAKGVAAPRETLDDVCEQREESESIVVVQKDHGTEDASRNRVEEPVRKISTKQPCHPVDSTPPQTGGTSVGRNRHTVGTAAMPTRAMFEGLTLRHGPQGHA